MVNEEDRTFLAQMKTRTGIADIVAKMLGVGGYDKPLVIDVKIMEQLRSRVEDKVFE